MKNVVVFKRTGTEVSMEERPRPLVARTDGQGQRRLSRRAARLRGSALHPLHLRHHRQTQGHRAHHRRLFRRHLHHVKWVFDLKEEDIYWCTADIGWVTGHSYIVYGPLQNGATCVMYEGAPNYPGLRPLLGDHREAQGQHSSTPRPRPSAPSSSGATSGRTKHDLSSLRLLGTVGEPINPEAWMWYREVIGEQALPHRRYLVADRDRRHHDRAGTGRRGHQAGLGDTSAAGHHRRGGYAQRRECAAGFGRIPGHQEAVAGDAAHDLRRSRALHEAVLVDIPGVYFTGDGAREDDDGYFWIMGRVDDVLNVCGHRLSTMEIESALVAHAKVAEAAVVGRPDEIKGQAVAAFVTLEMGHEPSPELKEELRAWVAKEIGSMAKPDDIRFTDQLPKTRSGKIMRRLLRELASSGEVKGDITTLEDMGVIARLQQDEE